MGTQVLDLSPTYGSTAFQSAWSHSHKGRVEGMDMVGNYKEINGGGGGWTGSRSGSGGGGGGSSGKQRSWQDASLITSIRRARAM